MTTSCFYRQLKETMRSVSRLYEHYLSQAGIQPGQFNLLYHISEQPKTVNQLAAFLMLDHSTVTRNMQVIHRLNWVIVSLNPVDKREKFWALSEAGRTVFDNAYPLWQQAQQAVEAVMSELTLASMPEQLAQLSQHIEAQVKSQPFPAIP